MREENPVLAEYKKAAIGTTSNAFGKTRSKIKTEEGAGEIWTKPQQKLSDKVITK